MAPNTMLIRVCGKQGREGEKQRREGGTETEGIYLIFYEVVLMECTQEFWVQVLAVPVPHRAAHSHSKSLNALF